MSREGTRPSPRTAEEPLAFTPLELTKGAMWTWLAFLVILELGLTVCAITIQVGMPSGAFLATGYMMVLVLGYATLYVGGIGLLVTVALTPVAWMLGRMLRRQRSVPLHLLAYTALGAVAAEVAASCLTGRVWDVTNALQDPMVAVCFIAAVISVPLGWWLTARVALKDDQEDERAERLSSRHDVDALFSEA